MKLKITKRKICALIVVLIMSLGDAYAHRDFFVIKEFGNVKVRIKTGFEYEEINNVALIGQSAEKLCNALKYAEPVLLDFVHHCFNNCTPDNRISCEGKTITIKQTADRFDNQTTLKLLEYAILNLNNINSIDTIAINKALNSPNSDLVNNTMNIKIYRDEKDFNLGVSYYLQNNRYHVFRKASVYCRETKLLDRVETVLIDLEHIFDFKRTGNNGYWVTVFDSDSSFYFAGGLSRFSKRHEFNTTGSYNWPFNIAYIGEDKIAIYFRYWKREPYENDPNLISMGDAEKTMIYIPEEDRLIEDLDRLLKQK